MIPEGPSQSQRQDDSVPRPNLKKIGRYATFHNVPLLNSISSNSIKYDFSIRQQSTDNTMTPLEQLSRSETVPKYNQSRCQSPKYENGF